MQSLPTLEEVDTRSADHIHLPAIAIMPRQITWTHALSGWAAVLILCLTWSLVVVSGGKADSGLDKVNALIPLPELTPEEHLRKYFNFSEFVLGEFRATLLQTTELDDGSLELRYMRRFEEKIVIGADLVEQIELSFEKDETIPHDLLEQLLQNRRPSDPDQLPRPGSAS